MSVRWVWSGNVSPNGFQVNAGLESGDTSCRLAVSIADDMSSPVYGSVATADENDYVACTIGGLDPDTQYWYQIEVNGVLDTGTTGKCKTFPPDGEPASFMFDFASCAANNSNSLSFQAIADSGAAFFVHLGDKHYSDIGTNDPALFRAAHETCFAQERQRIFHESMPVAYVWSDHDYGPNNSAGDAAGREASCAVYRQLAPHWELYDEFGIWQTFRVGRIKFIVMDERSYRDSNSKPDTPDKTMLGSKQLKWLTEQCQQAAEDDGTAAIIMCSDQQINISAVGRDEHWGIFSFEREKLGNILASANVPVVFITGDEHRSAFRRSFIMGSCNVMVLHHGAIDSGDPIAIFGPEANRGFRIWDWGHEHHKGFGSVEITDHGHDIKVRFKVNSVNQSTGEITVPFDTTVKLPAKAYIARRPRVDAHSRRRTT